MKPWEKPFQLITNDIFFRNSKFAPQGLGLRALRSHRFGLAIVSIMTVGIVFFFACFSVFVASSFGATVTSQISLACTTTPPGSQATAPPAASGTCATFGPSTYVETLTLCGRGSCIASAIANLNFTWTLPAGNAISSRFFFASQPGSLPIFSSNTAPPVFNSQQVFPSTANFTADSFCCGDVYLEIIGADGKGIWSLVNATCSCFRTTTTSTTTPAARTWASTARVSIEMIFAAIMVAVLLF